MNFQWSERDLLVPNTTRHLRVDSFSHRMSTKIDKHSKVEGGLNLNKQQSIKLNRITVPLKPKHSKHTHTNRKNRLQVRMKEMNCEQNKLLFLFAIFFFFFFGVRVSYGRKEYKNMSYGMNSKFALGGGKMKLRWQH